MAMTVVTKQEALQRLVSGEWITETIGNRYGRTYSIGSTVKLNQEKLHRLSFHSLLNRGFIEEDRSKRDYVNGNLVHSYYRLKPQQ